jgi:Glycine-zipper domain
MIRVCRLLPFATVLLLGACVSLPEGPSVLVLPGTGKNFDQFRTDERDCRQYAHEQLGGTTPARAATDSSVGNAVIGAAIGAVAGAAINGSRGARVGAGTGLLFGTLAGASAGGDSADALQQRYNFGYEQCMYAKGHKVPVNGRFTSALPQTTYPPPPPPLP